MGCIYIKFYKKEGCNGRLYNTFEVFFRALQEKHKKLRLAGGMN